MEKSSLFEKEVNSYPFMKKQEKSTLNSKQGTKY